MSAEPIRKLRTALVRWYRKHARDLPWRRTSDPYAIWVSEVMLQQTTVAAVIPYWDRFLKRFPTVAALARAKEDEVLALWTGLGYYRRAKSLREGAISVMERHDGSLPRDVETLTELPGIGRYTAGAIASLAYAEPAPVVDGNVRRVLSRLFAIDGRGASVDKEHWRIAEQLVRGPNPGDLNQAVMELGALICTPRAPQCDVCPAAALCAARALGTPEAFPAPSPRTASRKLSVAVAWIEKRGRVLLEAHHEGAPLRGSWDLPATAIAPGEAAGSAIVNALKKRHRVNAKPVASIARASHSILATRLDMIVVAATIGPVRSGERLRWIELARLGDVATSGATTKIVRAVRTQKVSNAARSASSISASSSSSGSSARAKA